jgi:hypothetical protein
VETRAPGASTQAPAYRVTVSVWKTGASSTRRTAAIVVRPAPATEGKEDA